MKLLTLCTLLLACSVLLYTFISSPVQKSELHSGFTYYWWDFIGSTALDQYDQAYYVLDDDQSPDCSLTTAPIVCEIYALKDVLHPDYPDLTTIIARRYPQPRNL